MEIFFSGYKHARTTVRYPLTIVSSILFRLCCVVHAARNVTHVGRITFTMNYGNSDPNSVYQTHNIKSNKEFAWEEMSMSALGCIINSKNEHNKKFYLRFSLEDSNAVFVLDPKTTNDGKQILNINEYYRNIHLPVLSAFIYL